jgi:hypothetical protein
LSPDSQFEEVKKCFEKFRKKTEMKSVVRPGEAASAEECRTTFAELVEEEGHHLQEVFIIDVSGLFWKEMPQGTYIIEDEIIFSRP